jgi:hypothetical protein
LFAQNGPMRGELRTRLGALGASDDDIARADASGFLPLLALERRLLPGARKYDVAEVASAAGLDEQWLRRVWRAAGFPDVAAGVAAFSDRDVQAAREVAWQGPTGTPTPTCCCSRYGHE